MPQIGWLEILAVAIIAILVLGPKEFPIALKKIGSYFGKLKNTISNVQREVSSIAFHTIYSQSFHEVFKAVTSTTYFDFAMASCICLFIRVPW